MYLTHEQLNALAGASKHPTLVLLLGYTGLRWGEAVGLRVRDVDLARRRINVERNAVEVGSRIEVGTPKSHKKRTVPFPAFLGTLLVEHVQGKGPHDLMFPGPSGGFLRRPKLSEAVSDGEDGRKRSGDGHSWFSAALGTAELPHMTLHDLRHTAASLVVQAGAHVKAVQRILGHASAAMTLDVYADLFDDDLDAVATALDDAASRAGVGKMWASYEDRT
ncbi:site-specific integrase [Kocuria sp. NPDC057446]|uniref:site-specific integrase n=1 Tax=Kocuria sp. NPDC057446 TaxID=3346137 RepID=UPI0036B7A245